MPIVGLDSVVFQLLQLFVGGPLKERVRHPITSGQHHDEEEEEEEEGGGRREEEQQRQQAGHYCPRLLDVPARACFVG